MNPLDFSLAYTGVLVRRPLQKQHSSGCEMAPERDTSRSGLRDNETTPNQDRNERDGEKKSSLKKAQCNFKPELLPLD